MAKARRMLINLLGVFRRRTLEETARLGSLI